MPHGYSPGTVGARFYPVSNQPPPAVATVALTENLPLGTHRRRVVELARVDIVFIPEQFTQQTTEYYVRTLYYFQNNLIVDLKLNKQFNCMYDYYYYYYYYNLLLLLDYIISYDKF